MSRKLAFTPTQLTDMLRNIGQAIGHAMPIVANHPPTDPQATERTLEGLEELYQRLRGAGATPPMIAVVEGMLEGLARDRFTKLGEPIPRDFGRT